MNYRHTWPSIDDHFLVAYANKDSSLVPTSLVVHKRDNFFKRMGHNRSSPHCYPATSVASAIADLVKVHNTFQHQRFRPPSPPAACFDLSLPIRILSSCQDAVKTSTWQQPSC